MTKEKKKIHFGITSSEGHTEYSLLPKAAVKKIKELAKEQNKWLYINGGITNTEILKESDLVEAEEQGYDIMMMTGLAGGNISDKNVEINFMVEKNAEGVQLDLFEDDHHKEITILVSNNELIDLVHNREVIVRALERKLEEFAVREVNGLRTALNI